VSGPRPGVRCRSGSWPRGVLKLETREAERLLVPTISTVQEAELVAEFPAISDLVARGDLKGASQRVDGLLRIDHGLHWAAYIGYRSRRLGRRRAAA